MTDNERISEWAGWIRDELHPNLWCAPKRGCWSGAPPFDTDITLWHGPNGLLVEILRKCVDFEFSDALHDILDPERIVMSDTGLLLLGMSATPAQLAAALVKMIEEESDEQS